MARLPRETLAAIAENTRRLRKDRGWSQTELAGHAGLSRSTIASVELIKYESMDFDTVAGIADAFGVTRAELTGEAESAPSEEIVEAFRGSPWADAVAPTDEEWRWLEALPPVFWSGARPTPEYVAQILQTRRKFGVPDKDATR